MAVDSRDKLAFGPFEFEPRSGRLSKHGHRLKLQPKSAAILNCLLEEPGEVVAREHLQKRLWADGTFVDYELGIKVAVKKLRDALSDSAEKPSYVQTVHGQGYRFVAPVEVAPSVRPQVRALPSDIESPGRAWTTPWLRRRWAIAAACALVLALASIGWRALRHPVPVFHGGGWVLIADFENRSGNSALDGSLEYALQRELSNSQFVKVVPRVRVEDALRLMRKPLDTRVEPAAAHEIMLRDGEIGTMLTGRVERLGSTYVLSVDVVDQHGVTVAGFIEEDPAEAQLAPAVRRLSNRVRARLGEGSALIQQSNATLEKVTTPSLHALHLYSQADKVIRTRDGDRGAVQLLEGALKEDPSFASAHVLLAYAYDNLDNREKALPHFQRAFELADATTDRERFFILASYYDKVLKKPDKAIEAYESLLRLYPDDYWAMNNLAFLYLLRPGSGNEHESARLTNRLADLRPNDLMANAVAAYRWILLSDFRRAEPYRQRALALANAEGSTESADTAVGASFISRLRLVPVYEDWLAGKMGAVRDELTQVDHQDKSIAPFHIVSFHFALGELSEAERLAHADGATVKVFPAIMSFYRGDMAATRAFLRNTRGLEEEDLGRDVTSLLMVKAGLLRDAASIIRKYPDDERLALTQGELALAQGKTAKGIGILEKALPRSKWGSGEFMEYGSLAAAYRKQGNFNRAIRVLETAAAARATPYNFSAAFRMKAQLQLAQLYREIGRAQDAEKIETELRTRLILADPDHPILQALQHRGNRGRTRER